MSSEHPCWRCDKCGSTIEARLLEQRIPRLGATVVVAPPVVYCEHYDGVRWQMRYVEPPS